jgi:HPt (histidine-containing phosphotransfer) domain-containing protein
MTTLELIREDVATVAAKEPSGAWIERDEVLDRCLGNAELARRVVGRFRDRLTDACRDLQNLAVAGDLTAVASRAHRLKGEAANVGCPRIAVLASDVEEFAQERLHDGLLLAVDLLAATCREFQSQADLSF